MPDVKEMFPKLMKPQRVRRGVKAELGWTKNTLTIDALVTKLAASIVDISVKRETSTRRGATGTNQFEVRRYILKTNRKFGYLCFKTTDHPLECSSYPDLQVIFNKLDEKIKWFHSFEDLVVKCSPKCSSREYITHLNQIMTRERA